jgi:hypothetical protein
MKKIILSGIFLLVVQLTTAQVNFGARMGFNLGTFDLKNENIEESYDVSSSLSILINMDLDIPFSTVFSFRTGLGLVIKGAEVDNVPTMSAVHPDTNWSLLYRMNYLEVPLFLVARAETDFYGTFYFGIGPTLSLGVGGRMELFAEPKIPGGEQRQETFDLIWGNKDIKPMLGVPHNYIHFRRFDLGLGMIVAYQLPKSGLTITAGYNKGLRNISPVEGMNLKTSYFSFSVGFSMKG